MNKKARKMLQGSIRAIDKTILVGEVVTVVKEQCSDSSLAEFANTLCKANDLLKRLFEYHHNIFAKLHLGCKKEKNSQI